MVGLRIQGLTYADIGKLFGVSTMRTRQIIFKFCRTNHIALIKPHPDDLAKLPEGRAELMRDLEYLWEWAPSQLEAVRMPIVLRDPIVSDPKNWEGREQHLRSENREPLFPKVALRKPVPSKSRPV